MACGNAGLRHRPFGHGVRPRWELRGREKWLRRPDWWHDRCNERQEPCGPAPERGTMAQHTRPHTWRSTSYPCSDRRIFPRVTVTQDAYVSRASHRFARRRACLHGHAYERPVVPAQRTQRRYAERRSRSAQASDTRPEHIAATRSSAHVSQWGRHTPEFPSPSMDGLRQGTNTNSRNVAKMTR